MKLVADPLRLDLPTIITESTTHRFKVGDVVRLHNMNSLKIISERGFWLSDCAGILSGEEVTIKSLGQANAGLYYGILERPGGIYDREVQCLVSAR